MKQTVNAISTSISRYYYIVSNNEKDKYFIDDTSQAILFNEAVGQLEVINIIVIDDRIGLVVDKTHDELFDIFIKHTTGKLNAFNRKVVI